MTPDLLEPTVESHPAPPPPRLSTDLRALLRDATEGPVSLGEIERRLQGRGFALCIFLFAAPFIVPAPGLSTPFGIVIGLLGMRLVIGLKPVLPASVLQKQVSSAVLRKIIPPIARMVEKVEKRIKPRMHFFQKPGAINLIGVAIVSAAFVLALPLPIPLSNLFPALSIMLLAAGMMERDGLLVIWGYVMGLQSWLYLLLWWHVVIAGWHQLVLWIHRMLG